VRGKSFAAQAEDLLKVGGQGTKQGTQQLRTFLRDPCARRERVLYV
jgi:hypothetical protein